MGVGMENVPTPWFGELFLIFCVSISCAQNFVYHLGDFF